jgi:hypothetical protein
VWLGDEGSVLVIFDIDGSKTPAHVAVGDKLFDEAPPPRSGPLELLRWRLEKLKERRFP